MKIGIFTFHCAANYGAVLQTYCLQEVLKSMGHEVYVIDYRPKYLINSYKTFFYNSSSYNSYVAKCKGLVRACLVAPIRWKRNRTFSKFINSHLNLYKLDLNDKSNDFDTFVFGSDQIWNPKITCGFDRVYLGDFPAAKGKKLIAYAASVGSVSNFSGEDINYFLSRLKYFDKVFVREKSLAEYINLKTSLLPKVVFDPVLLAGSEILYSLGINKHRIKNKKFFLLFQIGRDNEIAQYAHNLAVEKKLRHIDIISMGESLFDKTIKQTLKVEQLLEYFINASYIATSSFHGTVFAILFNKQFYTLSINQSNDERSMLLLESLNISDRMLNMNNERALSSCLIDYDIVNKLYCEKKIESYNLLYNSLLCR